MASRTSRRPPTVLVVGAASRDIDRADPRGWRLGGTVTYASLAIARLGLPVRVVIGVDVEAAGAHELGLLLAGGAEIELARLSSGPVFDNQQTPAGRVQIAHSASATIPLRELPHRWRRSDAVLLGPVAGELGPAWARAFPAHALLALAWQGLLRRLTPGARVQPLPMRQGALARRADLALVSAEDVANGNGRFDALGPRAGQQLAVSHGAKPVLLLRRDGNSRRAELVPVRAAPGGGDTTGAGDVLLGVWMAIHAVARAGGIGLSPRQALSIAVGAATAFVEAGSLAAMPDLRDLCRALLTPHVSRPI